jgi:glycosyltransferase involved in cell wall biosynthesis
VFCATSRLVAAKGLGELISAFSKLRAKHDDVRLWLAGDGPEAKRFRAQASSIPDVAFLGQLDNPLPQVAAADIFVHPSYHEGFSISLVEAAMLGKPIVACDVGGNPEIVSHQQTGLLIPAKDSEALLQAMQLLYKDRELCRRLGANARQRYVTDFEFSSIVRERIIPLYEN